MTSCFFCTVQGRHFTADLVAAGKGSGETQVLRLLHKTQLALKNTTFSCQAGLCVSSCSWHELEKFTAVLFVLANSEEIWLCKNTWMKSLSLSGLELIVVKIRHSCYNMLHLHSHLYVRSSFPSEVVLGSFLQEQTVAEALPWSVSEAELMCWELTWHFCHKKGFPYSFVTVRGRNRQSREHLKEPEMKLKTACDFLGEHFWGREGWC